MHDKEYLSLLEAYRRTFSSPHGRRVLKNLRESYQDRSSFVPGDPHQTAFREGERAMYLGLLRTLEQAELVHKNLQAHGKALPEVADTEEETDD